MKTSGTTEVLPLSKKQKVLCNVVMGVLLIAAGIILVLAGTDVIHAAAGKIAAPTVLFAIGIAILFSAVIAKNALSMWISGVIISCGLVSLIEITTVATYAQLYPIYIAAPGIGCIFSVWFAEAKFPQIKGMAFFIVVRRGGLGHRGRNARAFCGYMRQFVLDRNLSRKEKRQCVTLQ